ncbi:MAG: Radical domain protein, partial [Chloroflexi bacterium]|nr:Radical domain protein [Chloroflexota bacterium]
MARVEYRELQCKSVLNRVHGMPFKWSINPYRGCAHSCHYCYARGTHTYLDLGTGDDFSGIIFAKVNAPQVLRAELRRPSWRQEAVSIGSATDPYQPAEGHFRITRSILEALYDHANPTSIVTKGTLVLRDRDLLAALNLRAGCTVCFSVPTIDTAIWRASEPGTAPPAKRLWVMEQLAAA